MSKKIIVGIGVALVVVVILVAAFSGGDKTSTSNPPSPAPAAGGISSLVSTDFPTGIGLGDPTTKMSIAKVRINPGQQSGFFRNTTGKDMVFNLPSLTFDTVGRATTSNSWTFQAATSTLPQLFQQNSNFAVGTTSNTNTTVVIDNVTVPPNQRLLAAGLGATTTAKLMNSFVLRDTEYLIFGMFGTTSCVGVGGCEVATSSFRGDSRFNPVLFAPYFQQ